LRRFKLNKGLDTTKQSDTPVRIPQDVLHTAQNLLASLAVQSENRACKNYQLSAGREFILE
jgi:hypothetical protein